MTDTDPAEAMMNAAVVAAIRHACKEGLGFNCAFIDDDINVLIGLAQRAVLAGLDADCKTDMRRRFSEATEPNRPAHETALGFTIRKRSATKSSRARVGCGERR